ncbi:MAG TPA: DNA-directed RNA polymerase subunit omega [Pyrinomonadaceae bacterium]|jgi:DNA-directed RNA polymerase subunit omega
MPESDEQTSSGFHRADEEGVWPGIDSRFRLVAVAAQRSKQLQRGARPRISADPKRRRSTSIALEEVKLGLVPFINNTKDEPGEGGDGGVTSATSASATG